MNTDHLIHSRRVAIGLFAIGMLIVGKFAVAADLGEPIQVGHRYTMESKVLGETRTYLVHKPTRYDFTQDAYPILVVLDGEDHFQHTSAAMEFLANNGRIPQMIVVAVSNTDRQRDMTPPLSTPPAAGAERAGTTGGVDKFLSFIADELIPQIDRDYRTRPYRVLIGHSLGGLVAVHALVNKPDVFNGYIAISPSLWWDNQSLVKSAEPFLATRKELRADLYMTMGNEGTAMLGGAWKLSALLEEKTPKDFRWQFHRSIDQTHGSIPYLSTYEGLQAIFDGWYIHDAFALYEQAGLAGIDKNYAKVSSRMGYPVKIPEGTLGFTAQRLMQGNRPIEAEALVRKGLEIYPNSFHFYSLLGSMSATKKDEPAAIENFTKALALYPGNTQTRERLEKYKVDVTKIVPVVKLPKKSLAAHVGRYRAADIKLEITLSDDKLYAATTLGKFEIRPLSETDFYYVDVDIEMTFDKNRRGRVESFMMHRFGTDYEFTRAE